MRVFSAYFFVFLILVPISIPLPKISGKPVDLIYSDFLIIFGFVYVLLFSLLAKKISHSQKKLLILPILVSFFYIILTLFHILLRDGSFLWFISCLKFIKPFLIIFFAFAFFRLTKVEPIRLLYISAKVASLIVFILFISEIYNSNNFPYPRWGGYFFKVDVYGFPNSPAVYFVFLFSLILAGLIDKTCSILIKLYYSSALSLMFLIVIFTISRAAILTLLIFITAFFLTSAPKKIKLYILIFSFILASVVFNYWAAIENILESIIYKFNNTISGNDGLSHRDVIWEHALTLISEKPILGYGFEPFSNYSSFDTSHQQYLEIIYKSGILGIIVYIYFFYKLFHHTITLSRESESKYVSSFSKITLTSFVAILFSNLVQPTLSYSIAGNALIFYLSLLSFYSFEKNRN